MSRTAKKIPDVIAAVDLGSNSFHMVVARYSHGQLLIVDRLREPVRLAAGLDEQCRLTREASERALASLERFGQRLRDMKAQSVRVVGTNTLRQAKRRGAFMERARAALGHPIEIVSGIEEARLIHLGVLHTMPRETGHRLVADVGGGSTELIVADGANAKQLESLQMGCVTLSARHFDDGAITEKRMKRARLAARMELEPVQAAFKRLGWEQAIGTSGTIRCISDILANEADGDPTLTLSGVEKLIEQALRLGHIDKLRWSGMTEDRAPIFPGGIAILAELLDVLGIKSMKVGDGALREGLLYDLLGRLTDEDARVRTVRAMEGRYHVDLPQAERVLGTVLAFFRQTQTAWKLEDPLAELVLTWAAKLHEIGLDVSHAHYHRHGGYLLEHADMPGFPQEEQKLLACLVRAHRRKLDLQCLEDLSAPWHTQAEYLIVLLRLAVLIHRGRSSKDAPKITLEPKGRSLLIAFPRGWLDANPLTIADLEQEIDYLKDAGFRLRVD
jgi:exopolyphosphatase / guanosine-5'-triphosphate,3'-diphosphate pyrophosphatase